MYFYEGCNIQEVQAMRDLQNESFDFGSGLITVDCKESEDIYMKMHLQMFYDWYEDEETSDDIIKYSKDRSMSERRKRKFRRKGRRSDSQSDWTYKTNQNIRYKSNQGRNWKPSDKRRVLYCGLQLNEYNNNENISSEYWYWYRYELNCDYYDMFVEYWEEYLNEIEINKEEERLWNEEYEKNKAWYDSLDDY